MLNKTNLKIIIKTSKPLSFIKNSLRSYRARVIYDYKKNDVGLILKKHSLFLDKDLLKQEIEKWITQWDNYIDREIDYLSTFNVSLIISDITPQAFLIAEKLDIKSIGICNFTWYDMYKDIYVNAKFLEKIKEAYKLCNSIIYYPFSVSNDIYDGKIDEVGLISRTIDYGKVESIKENINGKRKPIIYVGIGKSVEFEYLSSLNIWDNNQYTFLISSGSMVESNNTNISKIPSDETEAQNYIAACDLVITKAGWSTLTETIIAKVPLVVIKRDEIIEDYNTVK